MRIDAEGIPARIDHAYLAGLPTGAIAPFLTGLRALGLIDTQGLTQPAFRELVEAGDDRPDRMADLLRDRYPWAVELSESGATQVELEAAFRERGPSGSTLRKAVAFYLAAARYAGLAISPNLTGRRPSARAHDDRSPRAESLRGDDRRPTPLPSSRSSDLASMRMQYFELLRRKAEEWGQPRDDILDRIERLIGVLEREAPGR